MGTCSTRGVLRDPFGSCLDFDSKASKEVMDYIRYASFSSALLDVHQHIYFYNFLFVSVNTNIMFLSQFLPSVGTKMHQYDRVPLFYFQAEVVFTTSD